MALEELLRDKLREEGFTDAGIAGLAGNLKAESGLIANRVEILCLKRLKENGKGSYTDESYTAAVDNGSISRATFLNPLPGRVYGYGLAQWTSVNRKAGLYDLVKSRGVSIGDEETQIDFLIYELKNSYKSVYNVLISTNSIKEASDIVLVKFESPADTGTSVKNTRFNYAQQYYDTYLKNNKKEETQVATKVTRKKMYNCAVAWLGCKESDGSHKKIIDVYNNDSPLPRGYKVKYTDPWCDTYVSAVAIKAGAKDLIGKECGVEEHIQIFKRLGIWNEDGTIIPDLMDIITYNWDDNTQPNNGYSDHIGFVYDVDEDKGIIKAIEGNYSNAVKIRTLKIADGNIRGYAQPKYADDEEEETVTVELPVLRRGDESRFVKNWQRLLRQKGYKKSNGELITVDNKFGANTENATERFQKKAKLKVKEYGVVDAKTWRRMLNSW